MFTETEVFHEATFVFWKEVISFVLIYLFHRTNLLLFILGVILAILGILVMLVFGYGIYKGRLNLQKVIDDFEEKLKLAQ